MPSGDLLALVVIGEAFEAVDLRRTSCARRMRADLDRQGPLIDRTADDPPDQRLPQAVGPARRLADRARLSLPSRRSRAADRHPRDRRRAARRQRRRVLPRRGPDVDAARGDPAEHAGAAGDPAPAAAAALGRHRRDRRAVQDARRHEPQRPVRAAAAQRGRRPDVGRPHALLRQPGPLVAAYESHICETAVLHAAGDDEHHRRTGHQQERQRRGGEHGERRRIGHGLDRTGGYESKPSPTRSSAAATGRGGPGGGRRGRARGASAGCRRSAAARAGTAAAARAPCAGACAPCRARRRGRAPRARRSG